MNSLQAKKILQALVEGLDPESGAELPHIDVLMRVPAHDGHGSELMADTFGV